jgi:antitoxin (DNA-binding transcriptional repressor) of toxin-antitoxin stability system
MPSKLARLSVTEARAQLCALLNARQKPEGVEITRRGRTIGLLLLGPTVVARGKALVAGSDQSPRRTLQGTVEVHSDLDAGLRKIRARLWRRGRG